MSILPIFGRRREVEDGKCRKGDQLGGDREMRTVFVVSGIPR